MSRPLLLVLLSIVPLAGCKSAPERIAPVLAEYERGRFEEAARIATSQRASALRDGGRDAVWWLLEEGKVLLDAGRFEESDERFARADERMEELEGPDISLTGEIGGMLTSPAARTYRGRPWERILLEVYRALDQLALGDLEEALVHCRRAFVHQTDALERHEEELDRANEDTRFGELLGDPRVAERMRELETRYGPAYANWANPFASFLRGMLSWAAGDYAEAEVDLRQAAAMAPTNETLARLHDEVERRLDPATPLGRVLVLFESGMAPELAEESLTVVTDSAGLSRLALPVLVFQGTPIDTLRVRDGEGTVVAETELLADVEAIVASDFRARYPGIVFRAFLSVVAKEVGTAQMRNEHRDLGILVGSLWKLSTAQADLRTWRTPGARFELAVLDRPPDGRISLTLVDRGGGEHLVTPLEIPADPLVFVLVRAPSLEGLAVHVLPLAEAAPALPRP